MDSDTARWTRAIPRRRLKVESLRMGQIVNPMSTAPRPKQTNDNPVPKTRHSRLTAPLGAEPAGAGSFKSVRSLDFHQQFAPADIGTQHQRFRLHREQAPDARNQARVVLAITQVDLQGFEPHP